MKTACACITAMVLTLCLLTGCGCRNSAPAPTTMPTTATTTPTTVPTTEATTEMTTAPTDATIQDGNGPLVTDPTKTTDAGTSDSTRRCSNAMGNTGTGITGSIG